MPPQSADAADSLKNDEPVVAPQQRRRASLPVQADSPGYRKPGGGDGRTAMRAKNRTRYGVFKETELPLEVVILMLGGLAMLITGLLLLPVSAGLLPYYANGLYGLLLVMFALQAISLGKTPFGDMKRSKPLLVAGVMVAAVGIVTCFIPVFGLIPRLLLFLCFAPCGLLLLLQMCLCKDKLRRWAGYGGIFRHLIASCSAVYVLSILTGLLVWNENLLTVVFGVSMLVPGLVATLVIGVILAANGCVLLYLLSILVVLDKSPDGTKKVV